MTGSASYPTSGATPTFSSRQVAATIDYNAATGGYTLTVEGRSQTFTPGQIDPALSNADIAVYVRTNGNTTDTLTLTRPGTSGQFTYRYVGGAFWQRTITGSSTISGNLDALIYGVETPDAATPRAGQANYAVGLLGAITQPDTIASLSGQGTLQVDFNTGGLVTNIALSSPTVGSGTFQGRGTLSGASNSLTGTFTAQMSATFSGQFAGRFFGPAAEEVGAAFRATGPGGNIMVGGIMGRQAATGSNGTFDSLTVPEFFATDRRRLVFDTTGDGNPATLVSSATGGLAIGFDPGAGTGAKYNIFLPEGPTTAPVGFSSILGLSFYSLDNLRYLRGARYTTQLAGRRIYDDFVFGMVTPRSAIATGTAGYALQLFGTLLKSGDVPVEIAGSGILKADFATGLVSATSSVGKYVAFQDYGTFNGTATLAATSTRFDGNVTIAGGPVSYQGAWGGSLFGPAANEVGASFLASGADGSAMSGVLGGARDDSLVTAVTPLAALTVETTFNNLGSSVVDETGGSPPLTRNQNSPYRITYDPGTGGYKFDWMTSGGSLREALAAFGAADIDPAKSDAAFTAYHAANGSVDARILKNEAGNPLIALTYLSLALIMPHKPGTPSGTLTDHYYVAFGQRTPNGQIPRSGTASFTGIALGEGRVNGIGDRAEVSGTMRTTIDFATVKVATTLDLTARDPNRVLADIGMGSFVLESQTYGGTFSGGQLSNPYSYSINGAFYGTGLAEIGGTFGVQRESASPSDPPEIQVIGAFAGKKD